MKFPLHFIHKKTRKRPRLFISFSVRAVFVVLMINEFELFTADIQSRSLSSTPAVITEAEKNRIKMKNDEVT
jgi:hypothetical protein